MALKTFLEAKRKYHAEMKAASKTLQAELQALIPEGYAVYWTQGTPSFNDGDPCVFSQGECYYVKLPDDLKRLKDLGGGYEPDAETLEMDGDLDDLFKDFEAAWSDVDDDIAEATWGDNVRVILTRDQSDVTDYYRG